MMKKLAAMLLTGVMAVSLAACGGSGSASTAPAQEKAEETAEAAAEGEAEAAVEGEAETVTEEAEAETVAVEEKEAEAQTEGGTTFTVGFDAAYPPYIWNGMTYTGREADYTWSDPYVNNYIVIAVMADSDINTAEDLAGKIVITQSGSSALTALESAELVQLRSTFASLEQNPSYNTCFTDMEAGAVDAIAVDIGVARYQMRNNPDKFRILEEPIATEQYAIAFKLGNEELRNQVQETYDEMLADGTVMKIAQNYADDSLPEMLITEK